MPEMARGPAEPLDKFTQLTCGHLNYSVALFHAAFSLEEEMWTHRAAEQHPEAFWTLLQVMSRGHI